MLGYAARGAVWGVIYLAFILAPLFALMLGSLPPARNFWTEISAALGYAGLAIMGLQFGLTARFRYVTAPWGEDVIYHFHRQLSLVAIGMQQGLGIDHLPRRTRGFARAAQPDHRPCAFGAAGRLDWRARGRINAEIFKRHLPPPFTAHEYFICGPNVMTDAIEKALGDLGVPMSKYHSERYSFV